MYSDFYKFLGQKIGMQLRYLQKIVFMLAVREGLALSLLVFGVFANYHNATLALDDLTLFAHGFNGRSYLHTV